MMHTAAAATTIALLVAAATPALAEGETVTTHADTLVVVTPNAPVVITNGAPGSTPVQPPASDLDGPPSVAPVAPVMAAAGPPQNEPWENVSHINGQLVEVGERTKYLKKTFKTSLSTNPIGWMVGFYGVSLTHAVHGNVALRADANLFNDLFGEGESGYEVGVSLPIYFKRAFSGPFFEPGLMVRYTEDDSDYYSYDSYAYDDSSLLVGPQMMFGWHWTFDSGLNAAMAFGIAKNVQQRQVDEWGYSNDPDVEPTGYFRIGYAWE